MPDPRFPKTLAAARKFRDAESARETCQWTLGDALLEECGGPGDDGVRTGVYKQLRRAASELRAHGFTWTFDHVRDIRRVAAAFPAVDRSTAASWTVHREAGDAETLASAQAELKVLKGGGAKLTVVVVKNFKRKQRQQREKAERESNAKLNGRPRPNPAHDNAKNKFLEEAAQAENLGYEAAQRTRRLDLSPAERDEFIKAATNAAGAWSNIVHELEQDAEVMEAAE